MKMTIKKSIGAVLLATSGLVAAGATMAQDAPPPAPRDEAPNFAQFDTDENGVITLDEIKVKREDKINKLDANGDGFITEEEMIAAQMAEAQARIEKRVKARFEMLDANGDGKLSAAELAVKPGPEMGFFKAADTNGDGTVDADELAAAKEKMHERMSDRGGRGGERMGGDGPRDGKGRPEFRGPRGDRAHGDFQGRMKPPVERGGDMGADDAPSEPAN